MPVHGRLSLTSICLRQLRRTCDALIENGIEATAVVIGDDANLDVAAELGFTTVDRDNHFVSRKFNDGIQLACDPKYANAPDPNGRVRGPGADYVVPCGSDDWVDHRILLDLPGPNTVLGFQHVSFVREGGRKMTSHHIKYPGGCGIRVYPRTLMERVGYRPADEDRGRACDTSILTYVRKAYPSIEIRHVHTDPRQIVDWKTLGSNLNPYDSIIRQFPAYQSGDPFEDLADVFPVEALEEMQAHYSRELVPA